MSKDLIIRFLRALKPKELALIKAILNEEVASEPIEHKEDDAQTIPPSKKYFLIGVAPAKTLESRAGTQFLHNSMGIDLMEIITLFKNVREGGKYPLGARDAGLILQLTNINGFTVEIVD